MTTPTYAISKDFEFSASHRLEGLAEDHPCSRLHGHNYRLCVTLTGTALDATGFVLDYKALGPFKEAVDARYDHRHLNDVVEGNPTAERLSEHFAALVREVVVLPAGVSVSVAVSETPKTWATASL